MSAAQRMRRAAVAVALAAGSGAMGGWYVDQDPVRVARQEADIREAGLFRLSDGGLVMRVRCGAVPPAMVVRLLLEVPAGPDGRRESWMIEGDVLYRRARGRNGWAWDEAGGVVSVEAAYGVRNVLLPPAWAAPLRWAVETLHPDWTVADRLPAEGMIESPADRIPELTVESVAPADQRPSMAVPLSLASRWTELASGEGWTNDEAVASFPTWSLPNGHTARWWFGLRDASGDIWPTTIAASFHRGELRRWEGRAGPVSWTLLAIPEPEGWTWLGCELRADADLRLEFEGGIELPPDDWRVLVPEGPAADLGPVVWLADGMAANDGVGRHGARSLWPLAAVAGRMATVLVAADPLEPAPFLWGSSNAPTRIGGSLPLAIASVGGPLRGRAVCALFVRCQNTVASQRGVMAAWHRRANGGVPATSVPWQWRLSREEAAAARGAVGGDVALEITRADEPEVAGAWRCLRLRPWALDLPLPPSWPADGATALHLLRFLSAAGGGSAWYAQAAMVGGVRNAGGSLAITPVGGRQLRVAVSSDPHLMTTAGAPWNRAMLELAALRHALEAGALRGLVFDALDATAGLDFNPAALAAADRCVVWDSAGHGPAVPRDLAAFKFLQTVRSDIGPDGPTTALENPFDHHPTLVSVADLVVVDDQLEGGDPRRGRVWRHRLLAGSRPLLRRISGEFEWADPRTVEHALASSAALGLVPSMGTDGRGRPYWSVPDWARRDAPALREWIPLAVRLAAAGWHIEPSATADDTAVAVETFGGNGGLRHVTVWNRGRAARDIVVTLADAAAETVVVDLRDAMVMPRVATGRVARWTVRLGAGEVRVFDVVEAEARERAIAWLETWGDPRGAGLAAVGNFRAIESERARGVWLEMDPALPFIRGVTNVVRARLQNVSDAPLVLADVRCGADTGVRSVIAQPRILAVGEMVSFEFPVDEALATRSTWLLWQWRFQQPETEWVTVRRTPCRWTAPVEIGPLSVSTVAPGVAEIVLPVRNHTDRRCELAVEWGTPAAAPARLVTIVEPFEARDMTLPVTGEPGSTARLEVRVSHENREWYRGDVRAVFERDSLSAR